MTALPYSQNKYNNLPKTSTEEGPSRAKRSRGLHSPNYNILNNQELNDREDEPSAKVLSKYRSMAELEHMKNETNGINIETVRGAPSSLLSPRNRDVPEYEPTKRDNNLRRSIMDGGISRSISNLDNAKVNKEVIFEEPNPAPIKTPHNYSKYDKFKKAPESLIDIDSKLNSKIMGIMRTGNLSTSAETVTYGRHAEPIGTPFKGPIS